jgi:hypothetical protein
MSADLQAVQITDQPDTPGTPAVLISATVGLDFDGAVGTIDVDGTTYTVTITVSS